MGPDITGLELAAAVSNAGGLGIIVASRKTCESNHNNLLHDSFPFLEFIVLYVGLFSCVAQPSREAAIGTQYLAVDPTALRASKE